MVLPDTCGQGTAIPRLEVTLCNGQCLMPAKWKAGINKTSYQPPHVENSWNPTWLSALRPETQMHWVPLLRSRHCLRSFTYCVITAHWSPKGEGLSSFPFYRWRPRDLEMVSDLFSITRKFSHKVSFNSVWSEFSITQNDDSPRSSGFWKKQRRRKASRE